MVKQELRELIVDHLAGGDAPDDVRGKYHPEVVGAWIDLAYSEFMDTLEKSSDPLAASAMVMEFEVSVTKGANSWTGTLPSPPLSGARSLYSVSGSRGGAPYPFHASGGQNVYLFFLNKKGNPYTLRGDVLEWRECPNVDNKVYVQMIPTYRSLDSDAEFNLPANGLRVLAEYVISIMRNKDGVLEDVINNETKDV